MSFKIMQNMLHLIIDQAEQNALPTRRTAEVRQLQLKANSE
jgi:hypothetical protein